MLFLSNPLREFKIVWLIWKPNKRKKIRNSPLKNVQKKRLTDACVSESVYACLCTREWLFHVYNYCSLQWFEQIQSHRLPLSISLLSVYEVQFYLVPLFWWSTSLSLKTVLSLNAYFNGHPWFVHYGLGTFPTRFITRWLVWRKLFNIRKYCWICEYGKCLFISEYCLASLKTMLMVHSIA